MRKSPADVVAWCANEAASGGSVWAFQCLGMVAEAWDVHPPGWPDAWDSWERGTSGARHGPNEPATPGAPVYFDLWATGSDGVRRRYGHIAVAANEPGYCYSIDFLRHGQVDRVAIADISQKWGPYVGWSTTLMGVALAFGANPAGMLGLGSTGDDVRRLQNVLIAHGVIADTPGNHDGVFGPGLDAAVRRFQQEHNLVVDGLVGLQTWGALS
jgi:hypothetical protein